MNNSDFTIRYFWSCILLLTFVYISNLFIPLTADAGKYAAICKNIVESGDWINLRIHHEAYDHKPHLIFWLGALSFKILGISAFAFKLPVILFSLLGFYSTYKLGCFLYGYKTGLLSVLLLIASEIWILFTNDIHTDILLASGTAFGLWQLIVFLKDKKPSRFILGFVGIGLAVMSKGIVALTFPVFAIGGQLIIQKKFKELFHLRWLLGIPIILLFLLPTVVGIYKQIGIDGLRFYFWDNNFGRVTGSYKGHNNDLLFYFHTTLYILLPWSLWALLSFYLEGREWLRFKLKDHQSNDLFLLSGISLFWILISVAKSKSPHFMLITVPFIAILAAQWLIRIFQSDEFPRLKKIISSTQIGISIALLVFGVLVSLLFPSTLFFWIVWSILLIAFVLVFLKTKMLLRFVLISVISIASVNFAINLVVFPGMFSYHSTIPACRIFNKQAGDNEILHSCNSMHRELFFYCKHPGLYIEGDEKLMSVVKQPDTWVYMDEKAYNTLKRENITFEKRYSFKHHAMTRQSIQFLNPKTRDKSLKNMYLVKIKK